MSKRKGLMVLPERAPIAANVRDRYLTPEQVRDLIKLARKSGRYGQRNAAAILIAWQHGLRVAELCALRWSDVNWRRGTLSVRRLKGSAPAIHYLTGEATRALRAIRDDSAPWMFVNERGSPLSPAGFRDTLRRLSDGAVHPHMLRHACGYKLVNQGTDMRLIQAYLGHRSPVSTLRYTEVDISRFKGLF